MKAGVPVLDGTQNGLLAAKHALKYRDFLALPLPSRDLDVAPDVVSRWRTRLGSGAALSEAEGMELLRDFGLSTPGTRVVGSASEAGEAADFLGYPIVLKTAAPDIHHKSDVGGVILNLSDRVSVETAYLDLSKHLGPQAIVQKMLGKGVEISLGLVSDEQFGPIISVGAGGVLIEVLKDRRVLRPPVDISRARMALDKLKMRPIFDGVRGQAAIDIEAIARAMTALSQIALGLGDLIAELDINPLIVDARGCVAADVLIIPKASAKI
jgi:acyl-CoA synthetase (NDP forming)